MLQRFYHFVAPYPLSDDQLKEKYSHLTLYWFCHISVKSERQNKENAELECRVESLM